MISFSEYLISWMLIMLIPKLMEYQCILVCKESLRNKFKLLYLRLIELSGLSPLWLFSTRDSKMHIHTFFSLHYQNCQHWMNNIYFLGLQDVGRSSSTVHAHTNVLELLTEQMKHLTNFDLDAIEDSDRNKYVDFQLTIIKTTFKKALRV